MNVSPLGVALAFILIVSFGASMIFLFIKMGGRAPKKPKKTKKN